MAAEKLARFTLPSGASQGGGQGQARGIFILFWSDGRSVGRSLAPRNHLGPAHSFSNAGNVARKNSSDDGCGKRSDSASACMRATDYSFLFRPPMSLRPSRLAPDGRRRRRARAPIAALPQWDFWLARVALLQFLASNPPPSPADRPTDRHPAGLALGSHVGGNNRDRPGCSPPPPPPSPRANVQMTRDESVRDPKPKNGATNALVPGCPLAAGLSLLLLLHCTRCLSVCWPPCA